MDFYDILLAKKLNGEGGGDSTGIIVTEETLPNGGIAKHITGQVISGTKQISSNGEFDVAAYKSVNVNVSGGGGGSLLNKKISITIIDSAGSLRMWESHYFISENGYVTKGTVEVPANSQIVQDVMIPMANDETYYFDLPMVNPSETVSASNLVNCTFNYDGEYQDLVVTDPTVDASVTLTYSRT